MQHHTQHIELIYGKRDMSWLLDHWVQAQGQKPFLLWEPFDQPSRCFTYKDFHHYVVQVACGLRRRGIRENDAVLIHLDNSPEFLISWFACAYIGALAVTTNTRSAEEELQYFCQHAKVKIAITQPSYEALVAKAAPKLSLIAVISHNAGVEASVSVGVQFSQLYAPTDAFKYLPKDPHRALSVQYTSGTTARPKGVLWTHANGLWGAQVSAGHQQLKSQDVHLTYLPLFHTNALVYSMLASLWVGATIVLQPKFSASRFWPISLKHRCTITSQIPFCTRTLTEQAVPESHHYRLWGNAICEPPTDALFKVKTIGWWGMTETITHGIVGDVDFANAPLSIGRAASEYRLLIKDAAEKPVTASGAGELYIKGIPGLSLFKEYLNDPESSQTCFVDGYFRTGDRVRIDEKGFLYFCDRAKDTLKIGGENVSASEIERVIKTVHGVKDVAVVGQKHRILSEVAVAFIELIDKFDQQSAKNAIESQCVSHLADFKRPYALHFIEKLPRVTLEKIDKSALRRTLTMLG